MSYTIQGKNTCGSGSNDPIMTGFTGRAFNFFGDVGKTYNLISSKNHQLSARLKLSVMSDHNGTTMDGVGFMYKAYRVLFELEGDTPHGASQSPTLPLCLMAGLASCAAMAAAWFTRLAMRAGPLQDMP